METLIIFFVLSALVMPVHADETYFYDRERGWFWFEENKQPNPEKVQEPTPHPLPSQRSPAPLSPRQILKQQGEDWENTLATAILSPSRANYIAYLEKTKAIQEQAGRFSSGLQRAIWVNPQFDRTIENPINPEAIVAKNQQKDQETTALFQRISADNALVFFFGGRCSFCHQFAPILKRFAQHYGLEVLPISLDRQGLPEYPEPKENRAMVRKLKVKNVPAVYLANPKRNKVVAVNYGYTDWSTLTQKLRAAIEQMEKETK